MKTKLSIKRRAPVVFFLDGSSTLGTESMAMAQIHAVRNANPSAELWAVFFGQPSSGWTQRVLAGVRVVVLREKLGRATFRLLSFLPKPLELHNIDSAVFWEYIRQFGAQLSQTSRIYCTLLSDRFSGQHLDACKDFLSAVFTTNSDLAETIRTRHRSMVVRTLPIPSYVSPRRTPFIPFHSLRVHYIGSFDRHARIDTIYQIANEAREHQFHFWGNYSRDKPRVAFDLNLLERKLPNAWYRGLFPPPSEFMQPEFHVVLSTSGSQYLVDAIGAGFPVVAPLQKTSDVLSEKTMFTISSADAVSEYLSALARISVFPDEAAKKVRAGQRAITLRCAQLQKIFLSSLTGRTTPRPSASLSKRAGTAVCHRKSGSP